MGPIPIVAGHNTLFFSCIPAMRSHCFVLFQQHVSSPHCTLNVAAFGLCLVSPTAKATAKAAKSDEHVYNICVINSYLSPLDCFVSILTLASFGCRTSRGPDGAIDVAFITASCTLL